MKNRNIEEVEISSLKLGENSRFRTEENLSELMESIKQSGILQPITARTEDRLVICGNRRLAAASKLGFQTVPVIFTPNLSDKKVMILNLVENMQRKDISSIEIGRQCDLMLRNSKFNMNMSELSTALGVSIARVRLCLDAFKRLPEKFRKMVKLTNHPMKRREGDLPESVVFAILNFNRSYRKLTDKELNLFLNQAADRKLTSAQIYLIGRLTNGGMNLKQALREVDLYTPIQPKFLCLKSELASVQKKLKVHTKGELLREIIKQDYPNLIY